MEIIQSITEAAFKHDIPFYGEDYAENLEGYLIQTSEQLIKIGISSGQGCCEDFGYLVSNDNFKEYIGAELIDVSIVDEALNMKVVEEYLPYGLDSGGIMFVNLNTNRGVIQFAVYNSHNGYYGHSAVLVSKQASENTTL